MPFKYIHTSKRKVNGQPARRPRPVLRPGQRRLLWWTSFAPEPTVLIAMRRAAHVQVPRGHQSSYKRGARPSLLFLRVLFCIVHNTCFSSRLASASSRTGRCVHASHQIRLCKLKKLPRHGTDATALWGGLLLFLAVLAPLSCPIEATQVHLRKNLVPPPVLALFFGGSNYVDGIPTWYL